MLFATESSDCVIPKYMIARRQLDTQYVHTHTHRTISPTYTHHHIHNFTTIYTPPYTPPCTQFHHHIHTEQLNNIQSIPRWGKHANNQNTNCAFRYTIIIMSWFIFLHTWSNTHHSEMEKTLSNEINTDWACCYTIIIMSWLTFFYTWSQDNFNTQRLETERRLKNETKSGDSARFKS
jgi:carboxypeptidase C (cathepsin A)